MTHKKVQWYPAFAAAFKLEMKKYYPELLDIEEYDKPSDVGILLVTKKQEEAELANPVGKFFRKVNIVVYKAPRDFLDENDYYRAKGLAYLYKSLGKKVGGIDLEDITITMVSSYYPLKMPAHFSIVRRKEGKQGRKGIYDMMDEDIPVQVIVIEELDKRNNRYIRLLSRWMDVKEDINKLLREYIREPENHEYEVLIGMVADIHRSTLLEALDMAKAALSREKQEKLDNIAEKLGGTMDNMDNE